MNTSQEGAVDIRRLSGMNCSIKEDTNNVALRPLTGIGLCAGVGWLDLAVKFSWEYHGREYRTVAFCERDAYAASVLLARMEDTSLEQAALCDSIEDIDERFRGVDCLAAGAPCQDISLAGKQAGIHGRRSGLLFSIIDAALRVGCEYIFLENVDAIVSNGLDRVIGSLADCGFHAEWLCLRASSVGASHRRNRWFCVARRNVADSTGSPVGPQGRSQELGAIAARASGAIHGGSLFAPGRNVQRWGEIVSSQPWLAPAIEPSLRLLVDGGSLVLDESRVDSLRCVGNGVVVAQAAVAYAKLLERIR